MVTSAGQLSRVAVIGGILLALSAPVRAQLARLPEIELTPPSELFHSEANLPPDMPYVDVDQRLDGYSAPPPGYGEPVYGEFLPDGSIYRSYLAGVKESRMSATFFDDQGEGPYMDGTLGGRFGIYRYGTHDPVRPTGIQLDVEGSAQLRLDMTNSDRDLAAVDFRVGVPLTWGDEFYQCKLSYYHLSSHVGDEYYIKHPGFNRLNYSRDVLVAGYSLYPWENVRLYIEAGWAFYSDVSQEWEFQYGIDYAPLHATTMRGAPFFAVNAHQRHEVNFGGNLTVQTGWAWRCERNGRLFRIGLHYYTGESSQYSFFDRFENQLGVGIWYDL